MELPYFDLNFPGIGVRISGCRVNGFWDPTLGVYHDLLFYLFYICTSFHFSQTLPLNDVFLSTFLWVLLNLLYCTFPTLWFNTVFTPFFFAKSCKYIKMILFKTENQIYPLNRHIYIVSGRLFKVLSFMGNPASFQKGYQKPLSIYFIQIYLLIFGW